VGLAVALIANNSVSLYRDNSTLLDLTCLLMPAVTSFFHGTPSSSSYSWIWLYLTWCCFWGYKARTL